MVKSSMIGRALLTTHIRMSTCPRQTPICMYHISRGQCSTNIICWVSAHVGQIASYVLSGTVTVSVSRYTVVDIIG
jgi:hypothetical protein